MDFFPENLHCEVDETTQVPATENFFFFSKSFVLF